MIDDLAPGDAARYRSGEWPREDEVYRASPAWFARLAAMDVFEDAEAWLDVAPTLRSFRAKGPLPRSEARRRYLDGDSIYILGLEQTVKPLRAMCDALAQAVAVDEKHVSIEAWAAGAPTKVGMHFDLDFNFNVQVRGRKRWQTAPNRQYDNPLESHHVAGPTDGPPLARAASFPTSMPDDARTFDVTPGNVVYLPRGVWHATETTEPTMAMAFVIKPPTWADHVSRLVAHRLSLETAWRGRVLGARDPGIAASLRATAAGALARAVTELSQITPSDVLLAAAWGRSPDLFTRSAEISEFQLVESVLSWVRRGEAGSMSVPEWALPAARFVASAEGPWSFGALGEVVASDDGLLVGVLVQRLQAAGVIVRCEP